MRTNSKKYVAWITGTMLAYTMMAPSTGIATEEKDLDEIVVTATKQPVNIQQVPLSVSVLSAETLRNSTLTDTADLRRLMPGVEFRSNGLPIGSVFSIRGVGTIAGGSGLEQSVGIAVDGVPLASVSASLSDLVDISRVEALKGPQGMLFGKNASAGLINIVTNSPELDKSEVIARVFYGTFQNEQFSGTVNEPIGENAAVRLSAWKYKRTGIIDEVNFDRKFNDRDSEGARFKFLWDPTEDLRFNYTGEWTSHNQNGTATTIRQFVPGNFSPFNNGAAIQAFNLAEGVVPSPTNLVAHDPGSEPAFDLWSSTANTFQADYGVGEGNLTAILSYRTNESNTAFLNYGSDDPYYSQPYNIDDVVYKQFSSEFRYTSPADRPVRYVAGIFYYTRRMNDDFHIGVVAAPLPNVNDATVITQKNLNYAAFTELTFDVTQKLHFTAGARGSHDRVDSRLNRGFLDNPIVIPGFNDPGSAFGVYGTSGHTEYNDVSWRAGLEYQFLPDVMFYATASKGYKGPGFNYNVFTSASQVTPESGGGIVHAETSRAYEVGLKSQWFERRLTANISIYEERFTNFQTAAVAPITYAILTVNAGALQSRGVDFDTNWRVTREFSLTGSVNYNHARFTDFPNAICYTGQTEAEGCIPGATPGASSTQNLNGFPLVNAPDWTSSLLARYEAPISSKMNGFFQATDAYKSTVHFDSRDPLSVQGQVNLIHLATGVGTADEHWRVTLYVNNLFDKHFADNIGPGQGNGGGGVFYSNTLSQDMFRTEGISVDARF